MVSKMNAVCNEVHCDIIWNEMTFTFLLDVW